MTRWKRESVDIIHEMHAHNLWSRWSSLKLAIAEEHMPVCSRYYQQPDGSWTDYWIAPAGALERIGGQMGLQDLTAEAFHDNG